MGRRKTGTKCITDSFSYSLDDVNIIIETEKMADKNDLSFSAYLVQLLKENLERKKVIDEVEPNAIGIRYNDEELLETATITEEPKGPTVEDIINSLDLIPEVIKESDAQQVDRIEARILMRLKEVKDRALYLRKKPLYDRVRRDRPINTIDVQNSGTGI
jgi:hypothetical protein